MKLIIIMTSDKYVYDCYMDILSYLYDVINYHSLLARPGVPVVYGAAASDDHSDLIHEHLVLSVIPC